jgi:hypothetical protein
MDLPGKPKAKKVGRNKRLAQDVAKTVEANLTVDTWPLRETSKRWTDSMMTRPSPTEKKRD